MSKAWLEQNEPTAAEYRAALDVAHREMQVSVAMLQRRLGWGYTRSALIVERMDADGLLGEPVRVASPIRQFFAFADAQRWESDGGRAW